MAANKRINFTDGSTVELVGDPNVSVKRGGSLLGKGGQGAVYLVKDLKDGKKYALKMYLKPPTKAFIENLRSNVIKGAPNDSFLWPLRITEPMGKNKDNCGYLMNLYSSDYAEFVKVIKGKEVFPSREIQLNSLLELVKAFEDLHAKGYSYQDLNPGGIFFDCKNGKVMVCDNDNVAPYGQNLGIQGMFKYMAPEVAISMFMPDKHSDRFSLAVLLFMLLVHAHPYDGKARLQGQMTAEVQSRIYGTNAVFIFDPNDTSNRPDPAVDVNALKFWDTLPDFIQALFVKTFTAGMPRVGMTREELERTRQGRATEKEWGEAFNRWLYQMVECPSCQKGICPDIKDDFTIADMTCPYCKRKAHIVLPVLAVSRGTRLVRTMILTDGMEVVKSVVSSERTNETAFVVRRSKKVADIYGLVNNMSVPWKCFQEGAKDRVVSQNEIVPALNGVKIEFDNTYFGEIHYSK